jgi:hypothetical protein
MLGVIQAQPHCRFGDNDLPGNLAHGGVFYWQ